MIGLSTPARSETVRFQCSMDARDVPTTYAYLELADNLERQIPLLYWTSHAFPDFPPHERCMEVSARLDRLFTEGETRYMKGGRLNGYPVVCATQNSWESCSSSNLLFTLQPGRDPRHTIARLRAGGTDTLAHTTENPSYEYIDILQMIGAD